MLLLLTDTSGKDGFVGLARAGEGEPPDKVEVIEEVPLAGGTFSAQLVPQISELLQKHGFGKDAIDAFMVVSGPGSFTGLRVGLAVIKALAEILQKPIVPVSLLEALAPYSHMITAIHDQAEGHALRFAVALDAARGEAFVGEYELGIVPNADNASKALGESLRNMDGLVSSLESGILEWIATPDQAIFDALSKKVAESKRNRIRRNLRRPRSAEVATVGWRKLKAGETVSPERLEANYIRQSDAEIFSKPASSS